MLEYIYFVKCPGCEDEHFNFFNEAKEFAMSLLSKKPIITQIEVDRNDFGECVDSCDLGTVWSWEEMMKDAPAEPETVFVKADTFKDSCDHDPEFATLDNSLDDFSEDFEVGKKVFCKANKKTGIIKNTKGDLVEVEFTGGKDPDRVDTYYKQDLELAEVHKPVPDGMSIKDLVEEMEENEDTVECTWCEELFDKSECRKEVDLGWLCDRCQAAIMSRGERLTFRENSYWDFLDESDEEAGAENTLEEAFDRNAEVEFEYDSLEVSLQGAKSAEDDWEEAEDTVSYSFYKNKDDVATDIWENFIQEADAKDVDGGLEALEDDRAWYTFLETNFDNLLDKYYDKLLKYYEDDARKEYEEGHSLSECKKSFLEELEEPDTYKARLSACPECGIDESFDHETGICINCGFNI